MDTGTNAKYPLGPHSHTSSHILPHSLHYQAYNTSYTLIINPSIHSSFSPLSTLTPTSQSAREAEAVCGPPSAKPSLPVPNQPINPSTPSSLHHSFHLSKEKALTASLKSFTRLQGKQLYNHYQSQLTPSSQKPPHPHPETIFCMTSSFPSRKGTGLAYQITKATTMHYTQSYHTSTPLNSEKSTTISQIFTMRDQTPTEPKLTLYSTYTSTHPKQKGTPCRPSNYAPLTSHGKENAKTSPKHTISHTSPTSLQTP